jgi:DnaJ-class molecular chaperone
MTNFEDMNQDDCPDCDAAGKYFTGEKCERCHGTGIIDLTSAKEMVE